MATLLVLIVLVLLIAAMVYAVLASQQKRGPGPGRRTLATLQVGDIVRCRLAPEAVFHVSGIVEYQEEGFSWRQARLADGETVRWLGIEEEDFEAELTFWKEADLGLPLAGQVPAEVEHAGRTFRLAESGRAETVPHGETGRRRQAECRYWGYKESGGEGVLAIEQWGEEFDVCLGEMVRPEELDLFAPSA